MNFPREVIHDLSGAQNFLLTCFTYLAKKKKKKTLNEINLI